MDCPLDLRWCKPFSASSSPFPWRRPRRLVTVATDPAMRKKAVVRPMYTSHVEAEQDLLTCGDCQREFVLSDIAKFVQHKVNRCICGKEKCLPFDISNSDSFDDNDGSSDVATTTDAKINTIKSSISAPIALKENADASSAKDRLLRPASPQPCPLPGDVGGEREASLPRLEKSKAREAMVDVVEEGVADEVATGKPLLSNDVDSVRVCKRDVGINTNTSRGLDPVNATEPINFVCHTCRSIYKTAWFLVQHVQKTHGMKVYLEHSADAEQTPEASPPQASLSRHSIPSLLDKTSRNEHRPAVESNHEHTRCHTQSASSINSSLSSGSSSGRPAGFQRSPSTHSPVAAPELFMQPPPAFPFSRSQPGIPPVVTSAAYPLAPFPRPPLTSEMAMVTPESLGELPFRRIGHFPPLPPGLEHTLPGFPFRHQNIESSVLDFYSQRLKSLAKHPPGSPAHSPSPARSHRPYSSGMGPDCGRASPVSGLAQGLSASNPDKPRGSLKNSPCEFCGKSFRFQSNLLVHRRTHTGEKPYRCLVCPHSCAQASKLKQHMRIHIKPQPEGAGVRLSDNDASKHGPVESKLGEDQYMEEDESDEDFDEMDEEEAANREAAAEAELLQFTEQVRRHQKQLEQLEEHDGKEVDGTDKMEGDKKDITKVKKEPTEEANETTAGDNKCKTSVDKSSDDEDKEESHGLSKEQKLAVLNEVMENSGLSNIQQFQDAYKQVVALSTTRNAKDAAHHVDDDDDNDDEEDEDEREGTPAYPRRPGSTSSMDSSNSPNMSEEFSPTSQICENGLPRSEQSTPTGRKVSHSSHDNHSPEPTAKKLKSDSASTTSMAGHHFPPFESLYPVPRETAIYPGIWFPPSSSHRELFASAFRGENMLPHHHHENGMTGRSQSALKMHPNGNPKPMSSLHVVSPPSTNAGSPSTLTGVPRRRNDTCEFCGKVFKNCSNLTVHRRSHTGEKPYKCALCSYACAQSSKLTRHMRTHGRLGKDVYRCKFCNMPFSVASTLEKHMRKCVEHQQGRGVRLSERSLDLAERSSNLGFGDGQLLGLSEHGSHDVGQHTSASSTPPGSSIGSVSPAVSASAL